MYDFYSNILIIKSNFDEMKLGFTLSLISSWKTRFCFPCRIDQSTYVITSNELPSLIFSAQKICEVVHCSREILCEGRKSLIEDLLMYMHIFFQKLNFVDTLKFCLFLDIMEITRGSKPTWAALRVWKQEVYNCHPRVKSDLKASPKPRGGQRDCRQSRCCSSL